MSKISLKTKSRTSTRGLVPDRSNVEMMLLALPAVLLLFVFNYLPMAGIVIAFKDFKPISGIFGSKWVGFKNFEFFFTSADALRTIRNTLAYGSLFLISN